MRVKPLSIKVTSIKVRSAGGSHGKVKKDDMMDGESTEGLHGVGSCASDEKPSNFNKLYIQILLLISEQVQVAQGHFKNKNKQVMLGTGSGTVLRRDRSQSCLGKQLLLDERLKEPADIF